MKLINWLKSHKALTVLVLIVAYLGWQLFQSFFGVNLRNSTVMPTNIGSGGTGTYGALPAAGSLSGIDNPSFTMQKSSDTTSSTAERMVVENSNLSLLVKDVRDTGDKILKYAKDSGGYMVTTSYSHPSESPYATITVRVPSKNFEDALNNFRSLAIKVTNENLVGTDVTQAYEDIQAELDTLEKTKSKFLGILDKAENVTDLLQVQREIINLQTQIDSLKGRRDAMKQEVEMTKITVYLSTDELSLPYTPDTKFRPQVIFKLAVRSLMNTLRVVGEAIIWVGVYSAIWIPAIVIYLLYKRFKKRKLAKL
jgi:hypothetical protein